MPGKTSPHSLTFIKPINRGKFVMKKLLLLILLLALGHYLVNAMEWNGPIADLVHAGAGAVRWILESAAGLLG